MPGKNRLSDFSIRCDYSLTTEMNPADDDHALLARYASQRHEDAFRQLVARRLNLVYSAAIRQTRAAHLAEEVAQVVFIELSRSATRIRPDLPLTAWLYTVTRRKSIDLIRRESTRHAREQLAASDAALTPQSASPVAYSPAYDDHAAWSRLTDTLDDAMMSLGEKDRTALLLRFFADQPLRDIGAQLGISDDAAQKRITRALDRLRENFSRRGFVLGGTTLAAALSAQAVQAAPLALGPTVSATALLAPPAAVTGFAALLAMTTLQKTVIATVLSLTLGCALYEGTIITQQRAELSSLRSSLAFARTAQLDAERKQAQAEKELADSDTTLAKADDVLNALANGPDAAFNAELHAWVQRVRDLKSWASRLPERTIPEMSLLTESDWLEAARKAELSGEDGARQAMSQLRSLSKTKFMPLLQNAVKAYKRANHGTLPNDTNALTAYLQPPADIGMLGRYEVASTETASTRRSSEYIVEKDRVDDDYDTFFSLQRNGEGWVSSNRGKLDDQLQNLIRTYRKKNPHMSPEAAGEILDAFPYTLSPSSRPRIKARLVQLLSEKGK